MDEVKKEMMLILNVQRWNPFNGFTKKIQNIVRQYRGEEHKTQELLVSTYEYNYRTSIKTTLKSCFFFICSHALNRTEIINSVKYDLRI